MSPTPRTGAAALALLALTGCGTSAHGASAGGTKLVGLFTVTAGTCAAGGPTGSTFRMVDPGGTVAKGPFVDNADSACADKTVTLLAPGTDGGLRSGSYQPQPHQAFGAGGNAAANAVVAPVSFFAVRFGVSTNPTDPQSHQGTSLPVVVKDGTTLRADLSAWSVAWNGQYFNQGAPKPGAKGATATGTLDPGTGRYSLDWTSRIQGGPFNGFTGVWHLVGTFRAA